MKTTTEPTLKQRVKTPPPPFFQKIIAISLTISVVGAAILGAKEAIVLPPLIVKIANYMVLAGIVASAISGTTVDRSKIKK